MNIRVAIIEDQVYIRESLRVLIDQTEGLECTATFGTMEQALVAVWEPPADVVLLDLGLPGMSGAAGIPLLLDRYPALLPLVITVYDDDERVFNAICAGAVGYLLKKTPPQVLVESIRQSVAGGAPMSPEIARKVIGAFRGIRLRPPDGATALTPHEKRLLQLIADGASYRSAAATLGVTVNTIAFHMRNIYQKLHVHSKSEAVARGLRGRILR